jgi:hypothetical protein
VHLPDHRDDHHHGLAAHQHEIAAPHESRDLQIGALTADQDPIAVSLATVLIKKTPAPSALLAERFVVVTGLVASLANHFTEVRAHGPPYRATRLLRAPPAVRPA